MGCAGSTGLPLRPCSEGECRRTCGCAHHWPTFSALLPFARGRFFSEATPDLRFRRGGISSKENAGPTADAVAFRAQNTALCKV